jgi:DNA-binding PadR family transcriptional regulator
LKSHTENHGGKLRKYYETTPKGKRMLSEAKEKIDILVREINE